MSQKTLQDNYKLLTQASLVGEGLAESGVTLDNLDYLIKGLVKSVGDNIRLGYVLKKEDK